ncbi:biotin/lipoyl-binding protein [Chloroflexota bacterium]
MRSWTVAGILLIYVVLVGSISCGGNTKEVGQQVEVVRGDLTITVSGSGSIEVSNERKLAFGSDGRIDEIYVDEGDMVNKDDVLAKLEPVFWSWY